MNKLARVFIVCLIGRALAVPYGSGPAEAAVGCTLNDPDRDIRRIFPSATGYKTDFITIAEKGGKGLLGEIEGLLGDTLKPPYETVDVPYAYYTVLKGGETVGYVHGVNEKGMFGGMQIILATDLKGDITSFYYQKLSSPEARAFRDEAFTGQFAGMNLKALLDPEGPWRGIEDPSKESAEDFSAALRGIKKNMILKYLLLDDNHPEGESGHDI